MSDSETLDSPVTPETVLTETPTTTTPIEPTLLAPAVEAPPAFVPYTTETLKAIIPDAPAPVLELLNKHKISGEVAKDLAAYQTTLQQEAAKATATAWAEQNKTWQEAVKTNPDWGGDKLPQTLAAAKTVMTEYGNASFSEMLNLTGAGNHPAMIEFLHKISKALPGEGKPLTGQPAVSATSLADRIFKGQSQ